MERDPVIIDAVRTPIGRFRGALKDVRPDDLAAVAIRALLERTRVPAERIDDVILGCANQAGEDNRNVARMALLLAGLPQTVPGLTVNRLCGSGLEAVLTAARAIRAGEGDLYVAGGVESMTRAPYAMPKSSTPFPNGNLTVYDTSLGWRFPNPRMEALFPLEAMGETAENLAERYAIPREAQDRFALQSHERAVAAQRAGRFADELCPVTVAQPKGPAVTVDADESPRADSSLAALAKLAPVFRKGGSVTAGNSSGLNDGAAAVLVASAECASKLGLTPLARVVGGAAAGVAPRIMGIGPVPATRKVLGRAGWSLADIDLAELNEAFAAQSLAVLRDLEGLAPERVNVNGGAIALGHPLGCSGARIVATLVHEMRRRGARRGLATMCIGVGQGIAGLFERLS
ncbi:MAG TPA: acetyl-CoA C-acyltransferase [Polyangia bacterium]|jgi:acetyl-CoA C-acetyltransferase|nr:acetyl-CoA C-acyltransferase [Polyangia bacterium]